MTPREKAEELFDKFSDIDHLGILGKYNGTWEFSSSLWRKQAKECALVAVNEVIEALHEHHWQNRLIINYWEEVKQQIEKL